MRIRKEIKDNFQHMRRGFLSKKLPFGEQLSRSKKILSSGKKEKTDKGKLPERVGRKVMGLKCIEGQKDT